MFDDAFFDVSQSVVTRGELGARLRQIDIRFGDHAPRQRCQPVEVVSRDVVLGRRRFHDAHLFNFVVDAGPGLVAGRALFEARQEALDLLLLVVFLETEFLFDRFKLLAQKELALLFADTIFDLLTDVRLQLRDVDLAAQQLEHFDQAVTYIERLEHKLQLGALRARQVGGIVGQPSRLLDATLLQQQVELLLEQRVDLDELLDGVHDRERVSSQVAADIDARVFKVFDFSEHVWPLCQHLFDADAVEAACQYLHRPLCRRGLHFEDLCNDPDLEQVVAGRGGIDRLWRVTG